MIFKIEKKLSALSGKNNLGRAGVLTTAHGIIHTPAFVPVGTKASVKALTPEQTRDLGAEVVLGNTYHLYLQPGDETIARAGGLHKFMNWDGPIVTDSGGFQVFSLGVAYGKNPEGKQASYGAGISKIMKTKDLHSLIPERPAPYGAEGSRSGFDDSGAPRLAKIGQDGVSFKSHLDGSIHYITPEKSIQIQHNLGADIIFAFDECTSPVDELNYQAEALERTHRWAERSLVEHQKLISEKFSGSAFSSFFSLRTAEPNSSLEKTRESSTREEKQGRANGDVAKQDIPEQALVSLLSPALFGIVQGGRDETLRKKSAKFIGGLDFDGFGIGGSFAKEDMSSAVRWVNEILSEEKPRHLLGIGEPEDLFMGVENGVDLFDCVAPTRLGRNGTLYTKQGKINITNAKYREDFNPIEKDCGCYVCGSASSDFFSLRTAEPNSSLEKTGRNSTYTRAYLNHLFRGKEMLGATLASIHNLYFIVNLVKKIRQSILDDNFFEFKKSFLEQYKD